MTQEEQILDTVIDIVRSELRKFEPLVCVGEVTHVNPLNIKVGSYSIDEDFMVIDSSCRKTVINIPTDEKYEHTHDEDENLGTLKIAYTPGVWMPTPAGASPGTLTISGGGGDMVVTPEGTIGGTIAFKHKHKIHKDLPKILVHRGLKVGDKVNILRIGSVHIIRGRVGILTNDGSLDDDGSEQL